MIHAAGLVEAAPHFVFSPDFVASTRSALQAGAPIFCDAEMVSRGGTAARRPANHDVIGTRRGPRTPSQDVTLRLARPRDRFGGARAGGS